MENIIAQQLVKMQGEILGKIREDGLGNIGETAERLFQIVKENTCELLRVILEATDTVIAKEAKAARKADGLRIKERNVKRRLQTSLGEVEYRRTYYETAEGEYVYLLDHLIGVESYERVSKALCAKLVNLAAENVVREERRRRGSGREPTDGKQQGQRAAGGRPGRGTGQGNTGGAAPVRG